MTVETLAQLDGEYWRLLYYDPIDLVFIDELHKLYADKKLRSQARGLNYLMHIGGYDMATEDMLINL